jgi:hypothetical protein
MAIYFAASNFDVAISRDKRKVRKFARRNLRFAGLDMKIGVCNRQALASEEAFQNEFGASMIYDVDQRMVFRPDFSVARTF